MTDTERRPKVLIFRSDYLQVSETFISDHLLTLKRYEPLVVCQRDLPVNHRTSHPVLQVGQGRIGRRLFENFGWAPKLNALIVRERPALVHAHFLTDAVKLIPFMAGNDLPFIVTAHGFDATIDDENLATFPDGARLLKRRSALIRRVDKILCVSQFIKDELLAQGYPEGKLQVEHLGIDLNTLNSSSEYSITRRGVLSVGRLVEKKGTRYLIEAYAKLPRDLRNAHPLTIIGDGPLRQNLTALANDLGVSVKFLGAQPRDVVVQHMRTAAAFVFPSVRSSTGDAEGMGIALMEAIGYGVPLCVFDGQPMAPILQKYSAAMVTPALDAFALAAVIQESVLGSNRVTSQVENARRVLSKFFDLKVNSQKLETIYDQVCSGGN